VRILFLILLIKAKLLLLAQLPLVNNAAMLGAGGTAAARNDIFSGYYNVANAALMEKSGVGGTFLNQFSMSEYASAYVAGVKKMENSAVGFTLSTQLNQVVRENRAQAFFSKKINDKFFAGVGVNIHQLGIPNSAYRNNIFGTFNLGVSYLVSEKLQIGFSTFNPNRTKLIENFGERTMSQTRAGFSLQLDQNLSWLTDFIISSEMPLNLATGLELTQKSFLFRGGFATLNRQLSFGFGFNKDGLKMDVGTMYHPILGFSPALTVQYAF